MEVSKEQENYFEELNVPLVCYTKTTSKQRNMKYKTEENRKYVPTYFPIANLLYLKYVPIGKRGQKDKRRTHHSLLRPH